MTEKPEILLLTHRIPYPPNKGDKIRSWRLFEYLTRRYAVHLACFVDDRSDFKHTGFLRDMCASAAFVGLNPIVAKARSARALISGEPLSFAYYRDSRMIAAVGKMRQRPFVAEVAFSSSMAPYIEQQIESRLRIVDFCDADSEKWRAYANESTVPMNMVYAREANSLATAETAIANWADHSFAITDAEAAIFNQRAGIAKNVDWWSNGVDTEYFDPALVFGPVFPAPDVLFVGAMDYRANIDSIHHFVKAVWPSVRAKFPKACFVIAGSNPVSSIRKLHETNGIFVTGRVDDVRPWLKQTKLVVAPLRVGRGVQNKVLEAMAMAKLVVASQAAAAGIRCDDGKDIVVAETDQRMVEQICSLLQDKAKAQSLGAKARTSMLGKYNWDDQLNRFDACLEGLNRPLA